jgi:hypothetical protein
MDLREVFATQSTPSAQRQRAVAGRPAYEEEVSRSYLSQIEKATFFASLKIVGRLAKALFRRVERAKKEPKNRRTKNYPMNSMRSRSSAG